MKFFLAMVVFVVVVSAASSTGVSNVFSLGTANAVRTGIQSRSALPIDIAVRRGVISVVLPKSADRATIRIYASNGVCISEKKVSSMSTMPISLPTNPGISGVFLVTATSGQLSTSRTVSIVK